MSAAPFAVVGISRVIVLTGVAIAAGVTAMVLLPAAGTSRRPLSWQ